MAFYTGDKFPAWKGNVFVGGMRQGEIPGTGRLDRVVFNAPACPLCSPGPRWVLHVLTEEEDGALLRIEPAP
jgi:hypothetical protein